MVHISHSAGLDVHQFSYFIQTFWSAPEGGAGNPSRACCFTFSNELSSLVLEKNITFTADVEGWWCKTSILLASEQRRKKASHTEIRRSPVEVSSFSDYLQGFSTIPGGQVVVWDFFDQ